MTHRHGKVILIKSLETIQSEYLPNNIVYVISVDTLKSFSRKAHGNNIRIYICVAALRKSEEVLRRKLIWTRKKKNTAIYLNMNTFMRSTDYLSYTIITMLVNNLEQHSISAENFSISNKAALYFLVVQ